MLHQFSSRKLVDWYKDYKDNNALISVHFGIRPTISFYGQVHLCAWLMVIKANMLYARNLKQFGFGNWKDMVQEVIYWNSRPLFFYSFHGRRSACFYSTWGFSTFLLRCTTGCFPRINWIDAALDNPRLQRSTTETYHIPVSE